MPQKQSPVRPRDSKDPRTRSDFRPEFYPRANGKTAPPIGAVGNNDRMMLDLLAAYYDLNCQYDAMLKIRKRPASPKRAKAERKQLLAIDRILSVRDALEDRYAPFGFVSEPVIEDGCVVDVTCSFGNTDARARPRTAFPTVTAYVPIPLPAGTKFENWPITIDGLGDPTKPTP